MRIISSLCIAVLVGGVACQDSNAGKTNEEAKGRDTAAISADSLSDAMPTPAPPLVTASYSGVLPCADCESQEVILSLLSDSSYQKRTLYMGRKSSGPGSNEFTDTGKYVMRGDTLILDIKDAPGKYVKQADNLVQLDKSGKRITGKLADKYVLKRTH
jgi:hypothetical protein